jgi:hypothetical protein
MKAKSLLVLVAGVVSVAAASPVAALARHGADDPAGHVRHARGADRVAEIRHARAAGALRADDRRGDDHGGHGADDGPNHR